MKTIITTLTFLLLAALSNAQVEQATTTTKGTTITVTVPVNSDKGEIVGGLADKTHFSKRLNLQQVKGEIIDGKAILVFKNVAPGTYGITILQDLNGNGRMDFELNGMPKENYGVSNNVMNFGPPQWSDAKFEVKTTPIEMEIRM